MKLYAKVESERASKGQGGNEKIAIKITDEKKQTIAWVSINTKLINGLYRLRIDYDRYTTDILRIPWDDWNKKQRRGKKQ